MAGLLPKLPKIISAIGTWLVPAAILLALGGGLIGYLLSLRDKPGGRKVLALGTGQRNLAAALHIGELCDRFLANRRLANHLALSSKRC